MQKQLLILLLGMTLLKPGATAQRVTIGGVVGTNLTDDVSSGSLRSDPSNPNPVSYQVNEGTRRFIFGLKAEVALQPQWSIEVSALRREVRRTFSFRYDNPLVGENGTAGQQSFSGVQSLSSWQFPVLAKYRFRVGNLRTFAEGGPSFRTAGSGSGLKHYGITAGGGVEWFVGGFRLSPTLRYTRWAERESFSPTVGAPKLNQLEFLLAVDRPTSHALSALGRRVSVGVLLGFVPGSDFRPPQACCQVPERNKFVPGVSLEARIYGGWSVELDGIYRPLHGWAVESDRPVRFAHLTWEFPVLGKYHFARSSRWQPFLAAGPTFRGEGNLNLRPVSNVGGTIAGGVESRLGWLKVAPQVRYTRWGNGTPDFRGVTQANQTQILVGLSF